MPLFDFECECGNKGEFIVFNDEQKICTCGKEMDRLISGVFGINMGVGAYGYYDETLETYVHTNRHRRNLMREKGVTEWGGTPKVQGDAWI